MSSPPSDTGSTGNVYHNVNTPPVYPSNNESSIWKWLGWIFAGLALITGLIIIGFIIYYFIRKKRSRSLNINSVSSSPTDVSSSALKSDAKSAIAKAISSMSKYKFNLR